MSATVETALAPGGLRELAGPHTALVAGPGGTLQGVGTAATLRLPSAELLPAAAELLAEAVATGHPDPVLVGGLPFALDALGQLVLPYEVQRGPQPRPAADRPAVTGPWELRHAWAPGLYADAVRTALQDIARGGLEKVVLARALDLDTAGEVDVAALVANLLRADPAATTFALPLEDGGTFVGATPAQLVARTGRVVTAQPLGGSRPRSADPAEDRRRGAALLASEKDRHEHAVLVASLHDALRPYCSVLDVPQVPELTRTAAMWHLATPVRGVLADPRTTALELAVALHPTPAVCGTPPAAARAAIAALEPADRGFYAGAVGWCDAAGDGAFSVAIRCALVTERRVRLWAGAGVVAGSSPEGELAETTAKCATVLRALGVEPAPEAVA